MSTKKTSLVTSCPACTASFYVTPEQLSAHRGEVRCGKCSHVFNALDRLSESPKNPAAPETSAEPDDTASSAEVIPETPAEQHEEAAEII
ncbi:MAG TPA: MJ0042-type zinc finger domain-containing protein, partial [Methylophilaceae bacterium]|nr:MJ0042-type zinc finger domain-containing protein [Methylophilaceae bacterium]